MWLSKLVLLGWALEEKVYGEGQTSSHRKTRRSRCASSRGAPRKMFVCGGVLDARGFDCYKILSDSLFEVACYKAGQREWHRLKRQTSRQIPAIPELCVTRDLYRARRATWAEKGSRRH